MNFETSFCSKTFNLSSVFERKRLFEMFNIGHGHWYFGPDIRLRYFRAEVELDNVVGKMGVGKFNAWKFWVRKFFWSLKVSLSQLKKSNFNWRFQLGRKLPNYGHCLNYGHCPNYGHCWTFDFGSNFFTSNRTF